MGRKSKVPDTSVLDETGNGTINSQELSYDEKLGFASVISKPMASKSQAKKIYKLIKKASKEKTFLRAGLKDVQRRIRLGERGICIIAGDVSPIDVICHIPGVCEDKKIPYCYTPSRADLGAAMGVKRGSVVMLVKENESYNDLYQQVLEELNGMEMPLAI